MARAATITVERGRGRRAPVPLQAAALGVTALVLLPIVYLVARALEADASSWRLIMRWRTVSLTLHTIGLAVAVTLAATAIGVTLAWLAVRSDMPGRRVWATLFALPLVIPSYVGAFTLLSALGPTGELQRLLEPLGVERLPDITGFPGAFLALTLFTYPYVYLVTVAGIRGLDPAFEEAGRVAGRSRAHVFRTVTLPLLRPSIGAGALLVALYTLHDFGAVSLMRYPTFTQAIFLQYKAAFDRTPAAILSLMLAALALVVVVAERRARGRARYYRSGTGVARPLRPVPLGRWRWPALVLSAAVIGVGLVLPAGMLLMLLARGLAAGTPLNLTIWAAGASALVSGAGAIFALVAATPIAVLGARYPSRRSRSVESLSYMGYALPGLVVALAFVFLASSYLPLLYQSLPLLVIAYVVMFLPQTAEPLRAGLLQLTPRMEEAARTLGRGRGRILKDIVFPLIAKPALAGAALVFLTAMKELPATLLLRPTGFETLSTRVWTSASAGLYSRAAVPALLLMLLSSVPLAVLARRVGVNPEGVRQD
ncbi:MAG: ABC transporter permease [Actinomycetota bacterium]